MSSIHEILKQFWGYPGFRPGQEAPIRAVLSGRDTLVLLPTGGGKSVCFQVPALVQKKLCIVVTPLIALMKDQVGQLKRRGIPATAVYSGMSAREIDIALDNCIHGNTAFLYVSPERLGTDLMEKRVSRMNVGLLVVDEAHCISQWGYDFRPAYLRIADFRRGLPGVPVMALTASATLSVRADILDKLGMVGAAVYCQTFSRPNLSYSSFNTEEKERKLLQVLSSVPGTSIVYVRTRRRTRQIAAWLQRQGIPSAGYHAGLSLKAREECQQAWLKDRIRVMVATNAFGMGIDKPDVRTVIHWDLPESPEAYYQEAGRAGRDGEKAFAVALYQDKDLEEMRDAVQRKYPAPEFLRRVYQALANYFQVPVGGGESGRFDFELDRFAANYTLPVQDTFHALKLLSQEGFIQMNDAVRESSRIRFLVGKRDLYDFQLRYPRYDMVIKLLLRLYGGELFLNYQPVSEADMAKSLGGSSDEVFKALSFLHDLKIADYERKTGKPQVLFLTPRYETSRLPLDMAVIKKRMANDTSKIDSIVHYATHPTQCRPLMLLQYFGEEGAGQCGKCDNCLQRKKGEGRGVEESLADSICGMLRERGGMLPVTLKSLFPEVEIQAFMAALHALVENEVIVYDRKGNLGFKENK